MYTCSNTAHNNISRVFTNSDCCSITTDVSFISRVVLNILQQVLIDLESPPLLQYKLECEGIIINKYTWKFQYDTIVQPKCSNIKNIINLDGSHCAQKLVHQDYILIFRFHNQKNQILIQSQMHCLKIFIVDVERLEMNDFDCNKDR